MALVIFLFFVKKEDTHASESSTEATPTESAVVEPNKKGTCGIFCPHFFSVRHGSLALIVSYNVFQDDEFFFVVAMLSVPCFVINLNLQQI